MENLCECGCGNITKIATRTNRCFGHTKGIPLRYILGHSGHKGASLKPPRMEVHPMWKGGSFIREGYRFIRIGTNKKLGKKGGYAREHILIAERILGHELPGRSEIHHPYGRSNNSIFVICQDHQYHMLLERRTRAYRACGHSDWEKCRFCGKWESFDKITTYGKTHQHKECKREFDKQYSKVWIENNRDKYLKCRHDSYLRRKARKEDFNGIDRKTLEAH